jgi:phospholipid/cholesterol/gamma-HCH transport system substrate-binding protein
MARQASKFMVGLFTIIGVGLGVVAIIWIGVTKYFEKGNLYVTYIDESVQGLQRDSSVKFRGVDVGRVESIRVAPNGKLIAVVMKINLRENMNQIVSQLKAAGITGVMFVELDIKRPGELDLSPQIDFPSEYPIIVSRPSEIQRILSGVNDVVEKFGQINTKGISDQLIATTLEIEKFFKSKQIQAILTKLDATAGNLEVMVKRMDKIIASGKIDEILGEAKKTMAGANAMITYMQDDLQAMKLPQTLSKTRSIAQELQYTTENLRRASETLDKFMERLYDRPSDLLFGKPPVRRFNE